MKTHTKNLSLISVLITGVGLMLAAPVTAQPYTFGPEVQTTNTANITYDSGSNTFQYTDAPNVSDDTAYIPLTGTAATFITTTNDWTVSVNVNISARWMTNIGGNNPVVTMGLALGLGTNPKNYSVRLVLTQKAGGSNANWPMGVFGTAAQFVALTNRANDVTTPLGSSEYLASGDSFLLLSGGTNASSATEFYSAATGVLTLSYNAATATVTAYYNGTPVGSYSLTNWGSNPPLTLLVLCFSGEIVDVPAGTVTASNFSVSPSYYTFGPEVQSTNSASMTYDSGAGTFQYTDTATLSDDHAYLPLTGTAASFITTSNGWTTSINVNLSARSMTEFASVVMGLMVANSTNSHDLFFIFLAQDNNTGGGDDAIYPDGWYGTAARFGANLNGAADVTTALGGSLPSPNGSVYHPLSGATNTSSATELFSNVAGVLTLSYNTSATTVTGYYNGVPVGSYSLAGWGNNPPFTLVVWGGSGKGVDVPAGTVAGSSFYAGPSTVSTPQLTLTPFGPNVILRWPTNTAGFTLQSSTNLTSPIWTTNSSAPIVVNGQNTMTNPISGTQQFFRLSQ